MPKAKISKEMIIDAAFEIAREEGAENIFARTVAARLHCSTQPVLYYFDSIEEIRKEAFHRAGGLHMDYIADVKGEYENPLLEIAIRYIRFGNEEKNLFRLLFQTDRFIRRNLNDWVYDSKICPIISEIARQTGLEEQKAREFFLGIYLVMHGYAGMLANNSMEYDEEAAAQTIRRVIYGQMLVLRGERDE